MANMTFGVNIIPKDSTLSLGTSQNKWKINGVDDPKLTDTTYSNATTSTDGLMSAGDKEKLNGIQEGAEVNPDIVINLTETTTGKVLDATQGKVLNDTKLDKNFDFTAATLPYSNNEKIALRGTDGNNYYTTIGELASQIGGGGGTSQTALIHYIKNCGTITTLNWTNPQIDNNITENMVVLKAELTNPAAQTSDWTCTTTNGYVTISGTISGSTDVLLYFGVSLSTAPSIIVNLTSNNSDNILKTNPAPGVTGALGVLNGGTGATTPAGARTNLGVSPYNYIRNEADTKRFQVDTDTVNWWTKSDGNWTAKNIINNQGIIPTSAGGTGVNATDAADLRSKLGITPANIGAVAKSGDTMTGALTATSLQATSDAQPHVSAKTSAGGEIFLYSDNSSKKRGLYIISASGQHAEPISIDVNNNVTFKGSAATTSVAGLMSAADKTKLDYMLQSTNGQALAANTNLNTVLTPGVYATWNASYSNAPITGTLYGYLLVLKHSGNYFQCWYRWAGDMCAMRGYANSAWEPWKFLYSSTNQTYTISTNSNIVSSCATKVCIVRNGWAYVDLRDIRFKSAGNSQMGAISGLPKAYYQVDIIFGGADASTTAAIHNAGDTAWIAEGATTMNVHLGNTYNYQHWCTFSYPVG